MYISNIIVIMILYILSYIYNYYIIQYISVYFQEKYPKKLSKCYVYNSPFVFNQLYNILCMFIDKETQKKIELVVNK